MAQGSITKRLTKEGKARYLVRVEYPPDPVTGKRRQRAKTCATRKEAEAELARWLTEIERGTAIEPSTLTVGALLDLWLTTVAAPKVKPTTLEDYAATIRTHLTPALGAVPVQRLTPAQVHAALTGLRDKTGARTLQLCYRRLSQALAWAEQMGLVARNVCAVVDVPRYAAAKPDVWTPAEAHRFLAAAQGSQWYAFFLLMLTTGLRRGEALGVRWQDLDLDAATLTVRQIVTVLGNKPHIQEPKSAASRRTVRLTPETVHALRDHRLRQVAHRLAAGPAYQDHDLVFATAGGGPIHPSNVTRAAHRLCREAGLPPGRVHALRHTHATWLILSGVPVKVVSARLGHAKTSITLDTYAHLLPGADDAAVEATRQALFASVNTA